MTLSETLAQLLHHEAEKNFRDEEELRLILKRRLTKKEYKILFFTMDSLDEEEICSKLHLTRQRYAELQKRIRIKLNKNPLHAELFLPS